MNEATIIARQQRTDRERKMRSDAINRALFSNTIEVESMRTELLLSRMLNVVCVLILIGIGVVKAL